MSFIFALQSIFSALLLQSSSEENETAEDALEYNETSDDPVGEDASLYSEPLEYISYRFVNPIMEPFAEFAEDMIASTLSQPYIQTDGPLTFGEPEQYGAVNILSGDIIPFLVYESYSLSWLGESGGIVVMAIVILIVGIAIRGLFDMTIYSRGQSSEEHSYITGFIWIVLWYPLFLALVNGTHALMLTFGNDGSLGFGLVVGLASMFATAPFAGIFAPWLMLFGIIPWVLLYILMMLRGLLIGLMFVFGPVIIAGKHSNFPVISRGCEQILSKSVAVVIMPVPIAPIMFIVGNFVLSGMSGVMVLTGAIFMGGLGFLLLFVTWSTFKLIAPQLASSAGAVGKIAAAAGIAITGGGGSLAYSAMRGGPMAAAARMAGNKWGKNDGSRK